MLNFLNTLWDTGLRLRCPVCEQGKLFNDWFNMNSTCPHCSVRFERYEGEVVGGMSISVFLTAVIFLFGYITAENLTNWPLWVHLAIWIPYACLFPVFFYRYSRALWVVILHVGGDVHWDYEPYEEPTVSIIDAFQPDGDRDDDDDGNGDNNYHSSSDLEPFPFKDDDLL